jgi:hypothetical protein
MSGYAEHVERAEDRRCVCNVDHGGLVHADLDSLVQQLYGTVTTLLGPRRRLGRPPKLSDAGLVCLAVAQVLVGARSERHWLRMVSRRLGHLFPYLPQQSGYNKRLRAATDQIALVLRALAVATPTTHEPVRLLDATPLPCGTSRETVKRSALAEIAGYGYCAAHSRWYWGLKLYLLTAPDGMPVNWCLATPALASARSRPSCSRTPRGRCWPARPSSGTKALPGPHSSGRSGIWGPASSALTAATSQPDTAAWVASASASRASSTPSKAS